MSNYSNYLARLLSACCFYLFLAKANIWLDKTDNTILVFGYRCFILLAPLFLMLTKRWVVFYAFLISTLGVALWFGKQHLIATILFSSGMAVGGFVLKYYAAKTAAGAANNRIALNLGGILTGLILLLPDNSHHFHIIGFIMMIITLICTCFFKDEQHSNNDLPIQKTNFSLSQLKTLRGLAWAITGIVIGIKLSSLTSVLPQYLIEYYGQLPNWYGLTFSINCLVVVLFQKPITQFMEKISLNNAIISLLISMSIITVPSIFLCHTIYGAISWALALTILECAISYLDYFARQEGSLLVKEFFVGVGMALTVLMMRSYTPLTASLILGIIGFCCILVVLKILGNQTKKVEMVNNNEQLVFEA